MTQGQGTLTLAGDRHFHTIASDGRMGVMNPIKAARFCHYEPPVLSRTSKISKQMKQTNKFAMNNLQTFWSSRQLLSTFNTFRIFSSCASIVYAHLLSWEFLRQLSPWQFLGNVSNLRSKVYFWTLNQRLEVQTLLDASTTKVHKSQALLQTSSWIIKP